jgi:SH3-like domain-containing protein
MKKLSFLFFLFFATMMAYAQCNIPAKIVDPDGYVNVRQSPNSKSAIVKTLSSGTKVYYEMSNNDWCRIANTSAGKSIGYIHSSRLKDTWILEAGIYDTDGSYTNLRKSPGGDVAMQLPTGRNYFLTLGEHKNGWWLIESITEIPWDDRAEIAIPLPQGGYWIHSSCITVDIDGDGCIAFTLYAEPKKGAKVIKAYNGGGMGIRSILDLSADKKYLKVKLSDGRVGWMLAEKTCYSPGTICDC